MTVDRPLVLSIALLGCTAGVLAVHPPSQAKPSRAPTAAKVRRDFDPATGRDLRHFAPHRSADIRHIRLDITVPDMNTPFMSVTESLRFTPIGPSLKTLTLDAVQLDVRSVACDTHSVAFTHNPGSPTLELRFDPPVGAAELCEVRFEYEVRNAAEGVIWTPESSAFPGRGAGFHTQGEPESNRYWIIGHDFPNERLTSEVTITVPAGYTACSNGKLVSQTKGSLPDSSGPSETYHFSQDKEHAPYLISLAVGKYAIVDVSGWGTRLPMPVYAPRDKADGVKVTFSRTPRMIALYERLFDEPYPWDKYAQVVVTNFAWGGMENTSATHLFEDVILDRTALLDGDMDELICHELSHQWFGDLLTSKSWEHIWLNEGWATYCEALWAQYKDNGSPSRVKDGVDPTSGLRADNDAYQHAIWANFQSVIGADHADAPFQPAMVSREYAEPSDVFDRTANPYPKGSAILHMLRRKLGDKTFFAATRSYIDTHRNQPVETFQFRQALEKASGQNLHRFFDQWCYRPGAPRLTVTQTWNSEARTLDIAVEQTQNIDGDNPAFFFDLTIAYSNGSQTATSTHAIQTRTDSWSIPCDREPEWVAANPDLDVLAEITVIQPAAQTIRSLASGPTLASRLHAAQLLGKLPEAAGVEPLARTARDSRANEHLRAAALEALGSLGERGVQAAPESTNSSSPAPIALQAMKPGEFSDARLRKVWIEQLARATLSSSGESKDATARALLERWTNDRSYAVRAASLRGLGRIKSAAAFNAFEQGLRTDSQDDQIRQAAIDALADIGYMGALDQVAPFLSPSSASDTRETAIKAAAKLVEQDRDRVFNLLAAIVNDPVLRTRRAAIEALIEINDPRARPLIEQFIAATPSIADRLWAQDQLDRAETASAADQSAVLSPAR
ncbi:MAG: HEAT repeat domain-containing protein [Phycisphaerales bacterium]|nr:HEAT repeat domain-containing protein [Phycisphaerales bacterium]